ncbi:MAG: tetratricopeptide repeat protein, partial [Pseudonocardia sp.]
MPGEPGSRSRVPVLLVLIGALLAVFAVTGFLNSETGTVDSVDTADTPAAPRASALDDLVYRAQESLRRNPDDALLWAQLGAAYVEQARVTGDPSYYSRSQDALDRSFQVQPDGNGEALIGRGQLANARHDFAGARGFGEQARALRPFTPEVYGVLADAYTQLGDPTAATAAVQQMLDVRPGLAAFTRA